MFNIFAVVNLFVEGILGPALGLLLVLWLINRSLCHSRPRLAETSRKLGIVTLILSCLTGAVVQGFEDLNAFLLVVFNALLIAGLVMNGAWLFVLPLAVCYDWLVRRPARLVQGILGFCWNLRRRSQHRQEAVARAKRDQEERERQQEEWERQAPLREARQRATEAAAAQQAIAARRREDARTRCELFFTLHAPELKKRFTRSMFDSLVKRYLSDQLPPEKVDQGAAQLMKLMQQHLEKAGHRVTQLSLAALSQWFLDQKSQIDSLALPIEEKEEILGTLEARFTRLQEEHIRNMKPV